jgi:hypothetical protein
MEIGSVIRVALPKDRPCPLAEASPERAGRGGNVFDIEISNK